MEGPKRLSLDQQQSAIEMADLVGIVLADLRPATSWSSILGRRSSAGFKCDSKDYPPIDDLFPRAMSISIGKWRGAHSKGDKMIRYAWSAADWPNSPAILARRRRPPAGDLPQSRL
jgi:hypothetical protein